MSSNYEYMTYPKAILKIPPLEYFAQEIGLGLG